MSRADDRIADETFAQRLADLRDAGKHATSRLEQITEFQLQPLEPPAGTGLKGWLKRLIFRAVAPALHSALEQQSQQHNAAVADLAETLALLGAEIDRLSADLHRSYIKSGETAGTLRSDLIRHTDTAIHHQSKHSAEAARAAFKEELAAIKQSMREEVADYAADLAARADLLIGHVEQRLESAEHDLHADIRACAEQIETLQTRAAGLFPQNLQPIEQSLADTPVDQGEEQIFPALIAERIPALVVGARFVSILNNSTESDQITTVKTLKAAVSAPMPAKGWCSILLDAATLQPGQTEAGELLDALKDRLVTGGLICARMQDPSALACRDMTSHSSAARKLITGLVDMLLHSDSFSFQRTIVLQPPDAAMLRHVSPRSGLSRSSEAVVGDLNSRIDQLNRLLFGAGTVALIARKQ